MTPYCSKDVTLAWLNEVMACRIEAMEVEVIGGGSGVLGELARIKLTYADGNAGPASIIGKFSAPVQEAREVASGLGFYEMEGLFYKTAGPHVPVKVPVCYFETFLPDTLQFVLLIEDISGQVVDQIQGCTLGQAEAAIDALVQLHSWGVNGGLADRGDFLRSQTDEKFIGFLAGSVEASVPATLAKFPDETPVWLKEAGSRFHKTIGELAAQLATMPATFVHGDFRADNLVFAADGNLTILDWQIISRSTGAFDVGMIMSQSLPTELRRAHGETLIERYLDGRAANNAPMTREEFDQGFRTSVAFALVYPIVAGAIIDESFPRSRLLASTMLKRACSALEDYGCVELL